MPFTKVAMGAAKEPNQPISRVVRTNGWTRLIRPTSAVHFAGGNTGDPHLWAFGTPHRSVAVIDCHGGAGKRLAGWHDLDGSTVRREN